MNSIMVFLNGKSKQVKWVFRRTVHFLEICTLLCGFYRIVCVPPAPSAFLTLNTLRHWYSYSPHCSLYILYDTDKENLFDNQELLKLVIISFILVTSTFDSWVILWGEIRSQSLLGVEGLKRKTHHTCCISLLGDNKFNNWVIINLMLSMWKDILVLGSSSNDFCVCISLQKTCLYGLCHSIKSFY